MTKQEQIEEMGQILCKRSKDGICIVNKTLCDSICGWAIQADEIYNAGYRKLPEDSIVLSREEYEILVKTAQGKISNMKATEFVKACISSGVIAEALSTK